MPQLPQERDPAIVPKKAAMVAPNSIAEPQLGFVPPLRGAVQGPELTPTAHDPADARGARRATGHRLDLPLGVQRENDALETNMVFLNDKNCDLEYTDFDEPVEGPPPRIHTPRKDSPRARAGTPRRPDSPRKAFNESPQASECSESKPLTARSDASRFGKLVGTPRGRDHAYAVRRPSGRAGSGAAFSEKRDSAASSPANLPRGGSLRENTRAKKPTVAWLVDIIHRSPSEVGSNPDRGDRGSLGDGPLQRRSSAQSMARSVASSTGSTAMRSQKQGIWIKLALMMAGPMIGLAGACPTGGGGGRGPGRGGTEVGSSAPTPAPPSFA